MHRWPEKKSLADKEKQSGFGNFLTSFFVFFFFCFDLGYMCIERKKTKKIEHTSYIRVDQEYRLSKSKWWRVNDKDISINRIPFFYCNQSFYYTHKVLRIYLLQPWMTSCDPSIAVHVNDLFWPECNGKWLWQNQKHSIQQIISVVKTVYDFNFLLIILHNILIIRTKFLS